MAALAQPDAGALLSVAGLVTSFPAAGGRRVAVVDGVDLAIARGEVLALVGESGCGKSLTALSIVRLVPRPGRVEAGRVWLAGRALEGLGPGGWRRVRGGEIGMIFQEPMTSLNPVQTVGAQVAEAVRLHGGGSRAAARGRARELFEQVGIPDPGARLDAFPHQLSGGLKQRAMIAIALAARPRLLIADEPTTALDVTVQAQILDLLRVLGRELGMAVLLITHDLGVVNELADRVAVMYAGRVVEQGTRAEVLAAPRHPYTEGLLRSLPARAPRGARLAEIPGAVPPPEAWPPGCRFAERCPHAFAACAAAPGWTRLSPTHAVRCHVVARESGV
ncbi:MAG: ABC transporter ATP-binding protein [Deltaproteobacteria bacterium]|nr:ABC transporter ATP-binding protein [Deltaproteobacteria bacterium]